MHKTPCIRTEQPADYQQVEALTRAAFYNLYIPGCVEHYLVHIMRGHADFIPELAFVLELDGRIIGNIMYTRATLAGQDGCQKRIVTFGPVCIAPAYQRQGIGSRLLRLAAAHTPTLLYFGAQPGAEAFYEKNGCQRSLPSYLIEPKKDGAS